MSLKPAPRWNRPVLPCTQVAEAGGLLQVHGKPGLHGDFQASLGCRKKAIRTFGNRDRRIRNSKLCSVLDSLKQAGGTQGPVSKNEHTEKQRKVDIKTTASR